MTQANPSIFRAYDIRGVFGQDFDLNFAEEFGNKITQHLAGPIVVGRDGRNSSKDLEKALVQGMTYAGAHVYVIEECTTPVFYFAIQKKNASGGVMITASHNPGEYNGFKVIGPGMRILGGPELIDIYSTTDLKHSENGSTELYTAIGDYTEAILVCANGASGTLTVGVKGPSVHEKILTKIAERAGLLITSSNGGGLEVVFDDDADRITFFDRRQQIDSDAITLLLAEKLGYKTIVYDFRFARPMRAKFKELGITAYPSRVGRLAMHENMQRYKADFGAELSGHYFFRDFQYLEAPEAVLLLIRNIIQKEGKNLHELVAEYPKYFRMQELSFPYDAGAFARVEQHFTGGKVNRDDGISIEYDDWWFNLRLSNTEPLMRLIVEANDPETLQRKVEELKATLHR